jgi:hypothetical protein
MTEAEMRENERRLTLCLRPIWITPGLAARMSNLPRSEVDQLVRERRIEVAWWRNKAGKHHALIHGRSLWEYVAKCGPAKEAQ